MGVIMQSMTVYFCWVCEHPVELLVYTDKHYETGVTVSFCSPEHHAFYKELKDL